MDAESATLNAPVFHNFIGGAWVPLPGGRLMERRNPADRRDLVAYVALGGAEAVGEAVAAASAAARPWRAVPAPERGDLLFRAARLLGERSADVAAIITREQGKTRTEADGEARLGIEVLEYMAGEVRRPTGETFASAQRHRFVYTVRQPVGIVGLITPWNFPLGVPLWKIAPALAAGNVIVWKPSRVTPLVSDAIVRLFADAGLPPGVLNVVNGAGAAIGQAIVAHPAVRAISFTSSYEVGTRIYSAAAKQFKKVQCEAGGKNAVLVLDDADVDAAAAAIVSGAFRYAGQRCTATSRVLADAAIADRLVDAIADRARAIVVGDGADPATQMGPISDESQMARVIDYIAIGRREGRLVCGGERMTCASYDHGWFVPPTVFDRVPPDAVIAQEEIFGPVVAVVRTSGFAGAIDAANRNRYGMAAAVFTRDASRAFEAAELLECGVVHVNGATTGAEPHVPFGGIKDTGVGDREMGPTGIEFFSEQKVVYVSH